MNRGFEGGLKLGLLVGRCQILTNIRQSEVDCQGLGLSACCWLPQKENHARRS